MTYNDIIQNNCTIADVPWWTKFAFHYTDVSNAINILQCGNLYSRIKASDLHIMKNDNASLQVIDMTKNSILSSVRFYFRPLTPTQYYNEGYKHPQLRYYDDKKANVPVPVFFAFDLEKVLLTINVSFSSFSQAGGGAQLLTGVDNFNNLNFKKIYSDGPCDEETRKYRQAEIIIPNQFSIDESLEAVLCRNETEKITLLNLLFNANQQAYYKYKEKIKICRDKMFERNGLYIDSITHNDNSIAITFADTSYKNAYEQKQKRSEDLDNLDVLVNFEWKTPRASLYKTSLNLEINYISPGRCIISDLPVVQKATIFCVEVLIEDKTLAYVEYNLKDIDIV